jgi:hypothetical protein
MIRFTVKLENKEGTFFEFLGAIVIQNKKEGEEGEVGGDGDLEEEDPESQEDEEKSEEKKDSKSSEEDDESIGFVPVYNFEEKNEPEQASP